MIITKINISQYDLYFTKFYSLVGPNGCGKTELMNNIRDLVNKIKNNIISNKSYHIYSANDVNKYILLEFEPHIMMKIFITGSLNIKQFSFIKDILSVEYNCLDNSIDLQSIYNCSDIKKVDGLASNQIRVICKSSVVVKCHSNGYIELLSDVNDNIKLDLHITFSHDTLEHQNIVSHPQDNSNLLRNMTIDDMRNNTSKQLFQIITDELDKFAMLSGDRGSKYLIKSAIDYDTHTASIPNILEKNNKITQHTDSSDIKTIIRDYTIPFIFDNDCIEYYKHSYFDNALKSSQYNIIHLERDLCTSNNDDNNFELYINLHLQKLYGSGIIYIDGNIYEIKYNDIYTKRLLSDESNIRCCDSMINVLFILVIFYKYKYVIIDEFDKNLEPSTINYLLENVVYKNNTKSGLIVSQNSCLINHYTLNRQNYNIYLMNKQHNICDFKQKYYGLAEYYVGGKDNKWWILQDIVYNNNKKIILCEDRMHKFVLDALLKYNYDYHIIILNTVKSKESKCNSEMRQLLEFVYGNGNYIFLCDRDNDMNNNDANIIHTIEYDIENDILHDIKEYGENINVEKYRNLLEYLGDIKKTNNKGNMKKLKKDFCNDLQDSEENINSFNDIIDLFQYDANKYNIAKLKKMIVDGNNH